MRCPLCKEGQRLESIPYDSLKTNSSFENIIGQLKLRDAFRRHSAVMASSTTKTREAPQGDPSDDVSSSEEASVPSSGGGGELLQCVTCLKDPAVALCEDCSISLCEDCERHHRKAVKTSLHTLIVLGAETRIPSGAKGRRAGGTREPWHCTKHHKKMKVYCTGCDQVLCRTCAHADHASHLCQETVVAAPAFQKRLKRTSTIARTVLRKFESALREIHHVQGSLANNRQAILAEIEEGHRRLIEALNGEKERQVRQLESIFEAKMATLNGQQQEFLGIKESLESGLGFSDRICSSLFIDAEFLFLWSQVYARLQNLEQKYSQYGHGCRETSAIGYKVRTELDPVGVFGEVFVEPSHRAFSAPDAPSAHIVKGQDFEFVISCNDVTGACAVHGGQIPAMEVKLIPEGAPSREVTSPVKEVTNGVYKARVTPLQSGNHSLVVKSVNGNHDIIGTVQVCVAPPLVSMLEATVTGYDDSMHPWGVASGKDCIVVSDIDGRVVFYNRYFQILRELEQYENENLLFNSPQGLAFDFEDNLIVVESKAHRLKVIATIDGRQIRTIGSHGNGAGQFENPTSVAVDKVGRIFVGDSKRVQYFNPDGSYLGQVQALGDPSPGDAYAVALDGSDGLFVASCRGNKVFALKRKPCAESAADLLGYSIAFMLGCEEEVEERNVRSPIAVAVDHHYGYVYVTEDLVESRLLVFASDGRYLASFKNAGAKGFIRPTGLCVLANSNVAVANGDRQLIVLKMLSV